MIQTSILDQIILFFNIFMKQTNKYIILGIYDTEERAKEILEEIIEAYLDCNEQNVLAEYAYVKNKVYEIPTE